jgi:MOSC domain-containing protein YiiM
MNGRIFQLNCSGGGVPKRAVREAFLTPSGLDSDRQSNHRLHGGSERALCLYALEHILELQAEGHPIFPGSVGENVTAFGLDWNAVGRGVRLALGDEVLVEISNFATPCKTIIDSFSDGDFKRISQKRRPGQSRLYARVLQPGRLAVGQTIRLFTT